MELKAASVDSVLNPLTRTTDPIVTGGTVLAIKYRDGVMMIADTLASYGSQARFLNVRRIVEANNTTLVGANGEFSDFQYIQDLLEDLTIEDFNNADGFELAPKEVHSYLARVMYQRRSKVDPLYNQLVVAGFRDGKSFLGFVDMYGSSYQDDLVATGFGTYLAIPILRKRWRPDLTYEEAKQLLEDAITVCYYRDTRAINRYTISTSTKDGNKISEPYVLETRWRFKLFVTPQGQMA